MNKIFWIYNLISAVQNSHGGKIVKADALEWYTILLWAVYENNDWVMSHRNKELCTWDIIFPFEE